MRIAIGFSGGMLLLGLYVMAVVALGDAVTGAHWAVQALYYLAVGLAWVAPARWLLFWSAGAR